MQSKKKNTKKHRKPSKLTQCLEGLKEGRKEEDGKRKNDREVMNRASLLSSDKQYKLWPK